MKKMKPRTSDELEKVFNKLVEIATKRYGKEPCMDLEVNYEDDAEKFPTLLSAFVVVSTKTRGKITESARQFSSVGILESEFAIVKELVRNYKQPDPEFEPRIDFWV
jgi:hypothetical protein